MINSIIRSGYGFPIVNTNLLKSSNMLIMLRNTLLHLFLLSSLMLIVGLNKSTA
jgi:hypothetical protein